MSDTIRNFIARNLDATIGVPSVCSINPNVLRAFLMLDHRTTARIFADIQARFSPRFFGKRPEGSA